MADGLPTLTIWQPWASLVVDPKVKRIETRSWAAPANLIGSYIGIHAAARTPEVGLRLGPQTPVVYEEWLVYRTPVLDHGYRLLDLCNEEAHPLPTGVLLGTARLDACVPMVDALGCEDATAHLCIVNKSMLLHSPLDQPWPDGQTEHVVSDQAPYGHFEPGRWAWLLSDAASTLERCPACLRSSDCSTCDNSGSVPVPGGGKACDDCFRASPPDCRTCQDYGSVDPIPARGRQRVWSWSPEAPS